VAALERAVALAQMHGVAVSVAEDLELDVARIAEIFFDIDGGVAESGLGFEPACIIWASSWSSDWTTFIPRPPPPEAALMITG
jgi:hypothetical protein